MARTVVKAEWIIRSLQDKQTPVRDQAVVIENGRIADITTDAAADAETIDVPGGIVVPGRLFADYDEGPCGRIRVMLGPHAADTCAPDLLTAVDRIARERNLLVTMHLAQSRGEVERVAKERGSTCADYLGSVGLLREGVIFAHGTFLTTPELGKVADSGAAIANCASVFLRGGKSPNFGHFKSHGVRVGLGTDAERMDLFAQMQATGFASKQATGAGDTGTSWFTPPPSPAPTSCVAPTSAGSGPAPPPTLSLSMPCGRLQPVRDPIRTLVWYASSADVNTVISEGRVIVRAGKVLGLDEAGIIAKGRAATTKLWNEAKRRGHLPPEVEPATAD